MAIPLTWDDISSRESGADSYRAKNPLSSAAGKYQMTDPFLVGLAKKYRPDLLAQYGEEGLVQAHYNDPSLQEEFKTLGDKDNAATAARNGIPYSDQNKGTFWRLGAPDAMKVMSADPNTPLDQILSPNVMKVNPDLQGKTAQDILDANGYPGSSHSKNVHLNGGSSSHAKNVPGPMRVGPANDFGNDASNLYMSGAPNDGFQFNYDVNPSTPASGGSSNFGSNEYFRNAIMGTGIGLASISNPSGAAVMQRHLEALNTEPKGKGLTAYQAARLAQNERAQKFREDQAKEKAADKDNPQQEAREQMSGLVRGVAESYAKLNELGAIVNPDNPRDENAKAWIAGTKVGQGVGAMMGTEAQSIRARINSTRPMLMQVIRKATEAGARSLDSEKELEFYLQSVSDPGVGDYYSNLAAIERLDKHFGLGIGIKDVIPAEDYKRVQEQLKLIQSTRPWESGGSTSSPSSSNNNDPLGLR